MTWMTQNRQTFNNMFPKEEGKIQFLRFEPTTFNTPHLIIQYFCYLRWGNVTGLITWLFLRSYLTRFTFRFNFFFPCRSVHWFTSSCPAEGLNWVIIEMASSGERCIMTGVSKYCEEDAVKQALCSSNSMTLKSSSKKPSFLARCWRLIRHSTLKERFFILSLPLTVKESEGRQQPKET